MKEYLGDSVYIEVIELGYGNSFKLTTENGLPDDPSNTIILEPEVASALKSFMFKTLNGTQQEPI